MSDKKSNDSRRKLLKSLAAGSGAVVAGKSLPKEWSKPVVDSVMLPAHAETTNCCESIFCSFSRTDNSSLGITVEGAQLSGRKILMIGKVNEFLWSVHGSLNGEGAFSGIITLPGGSHIKVRGTVSDNGKQIEVLVIWTQPDGRFLGAAHFEATASEGVSSLDQCPV